MERAIYLDAHVSSLFPIVQPHPFPFPKRLGTSRARQGKATQGKARQGKRERGGGGWAQLLLIVKRRIKKGEEKALGGWGWVAGGQRKRREK